MSEVSEAIELDGQWKPFKKGSVQWNSIKGSRARLNLWYGSTQSSKTVASIERWSLFVSKNDGMMLMVGKTLDSLKRNILMPMQQNYDNDYVFSYSLGRREAVLFGKVIQLIGANDDRAEGKIRGIAVVGVLGDEVSLWPENFFKMLLSRMSKPGAMGFFTTNPDSPTHFIKRDFIDRADELDMNVYKFLLDDNPFVNDDYKVNIKREYVGFWYKRFIEALWVAAEGVVYDMFDEDKHVKKYHGNHLDFNYKVVSLDYGTSNPFVAGLWGFNQIGGPYYLVSEFWYDSKVKQKQLTDGQYCDRMEKWMEGLGLKPSDVYPFIYDPSAASFGVEMRNRGWRIKPAINDVDDGIRVVSGLLGENKIYIDPSCKNTIREFYSYEWDKKVNDHAMDMLRYFVYTRVYKKCKTAIVSKEVDYTKYLMK